MNNLHRAILMSVVFCLCGALSASDWPTYLHDIRRVGHTADPLNAPLSLRWTVAAPAAPKLSFPGPLNKIFEGKQLRHRIRYDDVFQVALAGGRAYFGSSVDNRVYCRDLDTGREIWNFFTDGPVRLAPTVSDGRVYVGSDDGFAYCLDAADGRVVWKLRAGPRDERILARGRIASRWPVRTSILVDDGTAYFGAGIFPHERIFLYAVEARTGKVVWKNDEISQTDASRNDLTPQGYLLATKDILFFPSGRSLPAAINRKTGRLMHKPRPGWRREAGGQIGGTQALLADNQLYTVGEHHILALSQDRGKTGFAWFKGRQMTLAGERAYLVNGEEVIAVNRLEHAEGTRLRQKLKLDLYNVSRAVSRHRARRESTEVRRLQAEFKKAPDSEKLKDALAAATKKYEASRKDYEAKKTQRDELREKLKEAGDAGIVWRAKSPHESALILSGATLVAGGKGEVVAFNAETGEAVWSHKVDGEARGLASSDGYLTVSTTTGKIYCFGDAGKKAAPLARPAAPETADPYAKDGLSAVTAAAADEIVRETGITRGFCLVLGGEEGRLAYELAKRTELKIYAVEASAEKVRKAREALARAGLYGSRVTVDLADLGVTPYPSYFANLIVSDTLLKTERLPGNPERVARLLKPIGGTICFSKGAEVRTWLERSKLLAEDAKLRTSGRWTVVTRGPLPGADNWSHQYGNPGNTASNQDYRVRGGLSVLWYGDPGPGRVLNRHAGAVGPVSANGRLFVQGDESILAYDAYNGEFLWELENPGARRTGVFNNWEPGNLAATDDHLFTVIADKVLQIDAATGKLVRSLEVPKSDPPEKRDWGYVAVKDGILYGTSTRRELLAAGQRRRGHDSEGATDTVFAFDAATGKKLWTYQGKSIAHPTIAIGDGRIFFIDSTLTSGQRERLLRQDKSELKELTDEARKVAEERMKRIDARLAVGLDSRSGRTLWSKPVDVTDCTGVGIGAGKLTLMYHNNHVVLCGANANGHYWRQFLSGEFKRRRLVVLTADGGEKLWSRDANYRHRPIIVGGDIIAEPWAFDLYTGKQKTRQHPLTGEETPWKFARPGHHCGAISATPGMMFYRSGFTAYYDLEKDSGTRHFAGHRLGCWINSIPANGLLMIPEASAGCVCLFSMAATVVFEPRENRQVWGVYSAEGLRTPVRHMALNVGAPGDRRDARGKLWLSYPRPSSRAGIDLPLSLKPKFASGGDYFAKNDEAYEVRGTDTPWIYASGAEGLVRCELPLLREGQEAATYTVKLYFAAPEGDTAGQRIFDVKLQGKTVAVSLDVAARAGSARRAHIMTFTEVPVSAGLVVELVPKTGKPILSALEVLRTNAEEILK